MNFWFRLNEKIRFLILASANMGLRYLIFVLCGLVWGMEHYQIILAFSWGSSVFIAFYLYKHFVFLSKNEHLPEFLKSLLIWVITYLFNVYFLNLFVSQFGLNTYLSQGILIVIIFIVNYFLFKHFAFKISD